MIKREQGQDERKERFKKEKREQRRSLLNPPVCSYEATPRLQRPDLIWYQVGTYKCVWLRKQLYIQVCVAT